MKKRSFWSQVNAQLDADHSVYLALVAGHSRHSPGTRGAKMCISTSDVFGTVGGGVMEHSIISRGRAELLNNGPLFRSEVLVHRDSGNAKRSGLFCAGEQKMVYVIATPGSDEHRTITDAAHRFETDGGGFLSIRENDWSIVEQEWDRASPPITFVDEEYRELLFNPFRIAIVGGGHCGRALSQTMSQLGYYVTNIDEREHEETFVTNVWADRRETIAYDLAASVISRPSLTHLVVMTANFPTDVSALKSVGELSFPYIGVMGSPAKLTRIRQEVPEALFDRLFAPIGLDMSSDTPEEIAISIAAEILSVREDLFVWTHPDV